MESIEQMIKRLCPKGVEWKKISEIAYYPKVRINTETLSVDTYVGVESLIKDRGGKTSSSSLPEGVAIEFLPQDILIGNIRPYLKKIWLSDCQGGTNGDVICIRVLDSKEVIPKYLYHNLASDKFFDYDNSHAKGGKMPRGDKNAILAYKIPLPPLEIQSRIVEVLDKMATLTAELEAELKAELEARKQQYEYYRNKLLIFNEIGGGNRQVAWKKISEIGTIYRGIAYSKKDFTDTGTPCIHYGQIYTRYGTFANKTFTCVSKELAKGKRLAKKGDLVMAVTSENMEDVGKCLAWLGEDEILVSNHACFIRHSLNPKYLAYFLQTSYFFKYKKKISKGVKVIDLDLNKFGNMLIPVPPLSEQQRIVSILDRFEALTTDLQSGLPAEIEARRQQYEYYRNKLLTFEAV